MSEPEPEDNWVGPLKPKELKEELLDALDTIESTRTFAAFGCLSNFQDPDIFVPAIGKIKLPLQKETAQSLIQACHQAPFGKGDQTIVDTSVRNTWELNNDQFEIRSPVWPEFLKEVTKRALDELGFDEVEQFGVRAELYKLLLYEKGAMFKPHKDTEKAPGMFGTLVICLPSAHSGGSLKVKHAGVTKAYPFDIHPPSFACWYSDVLHEVTPVKDGYRFVLTFNLTSDARATRPSAQSMCHVHVALNKILARWKCEHGLASGLPEYLVNLLDHEYTKQGLTLQSLKGRDREVVRAVQEACSNNGFVCFLAACEKEVEGGCDEDDYYEDDFENEFEDEDEDECEHANGYRRLHGSGPAPRSDGYHEIIEVCNESLSLKHIVNMNGTIVSENLDVSEDNFLHEKPFELRRIKQEEYSGYTGNEGVSATHWYNDTALVIMPNTKVVQFLLRGYTAPSNPWYNWAFERNTKPKLNHESLINYFEELQAAEPEEASHAESLKQICRKVLSEAEQFSELVIQRVVDLGTRLDDLSLLETALAPRLAQLPMLVLQAIGKTVCKINLDDCKSLLSRPLSNVNTFRERYRVLKCWMDMLAAKSNPLGTEDDQKLKFLLHIRDEMLTKEDSLEPQDAEFLFKAEGAQQLPNDHIERLPGIIELNRGSTLFVISFLDVLSDELRTNHKMEREQAESLFKACFPHLCNEFKIPPPELESESAAVSWSLLAHPSRALAKEEEPNLSNYWEIVADASIKLSRVFQQAIDLGLKDDAESMLHTISQAQDQCHADHYRHFFLPFLRSMLPVWEANNISLRDPVCHDLYTCVLLEYARRYVGEEPQCPEVDWARSRIPCHRGCNDCGLLNNFITDPKRKQARFAMGKGRRQHLHQQLDGAMEEYTHETKRTGNPQTLVVTKTRTAWQKKVTEWNHRRAEAKKELGLYNIDTLHELLGDIDFNIIAERVGLERVGARTAKRQKTGETGSGAGHQALASNPQGQNTGYCSTISSAGSKRKHAEIIDLTGD